MRLRHLTHPPLLRRLAGMHLIHAVLIAIAGFGAVAPSARFVSSTKAPHLAAQATGEEDERDQTQDRDTDQSQDQDISDLTKLFVASESEQDASLAPQLILLVRPSSVSTQKRTSQMRAPSFDQRRRARTPRRAVTSQTCRLML